jgi:hypothetical protein
VCRELPGLTSIEVGLDVVPPELAAALASLPQVQSVCLDCEELPAGGSVWRSLGQLGSKLQHLDMMLRNTQLADATSQEGLADLEQPAGATHLHLLADLLALTAVQHLALHILGSDGEQLNALAALDQLPTLHALMLQQNESVPEVVWNCGHLTSLRLLHSHLSGVPDAVGRQLSRLRQLALSTCSAARGKFPAALCTLSQLTTLVIHSFERWGPNGWPIRVALPPQLSHLRQAKTPGAAFAGVSQPQLSTCSGAGRQWPVDAAVVASMPCRLLEQLAI